MYLGHLVHFNFGPGLVPAQSYVPLITYLLGYFRLYLLPSAVRRAGVARAPCPAPCTALRLPNGEIMEAHILTIDRARKERAFVVECLSAKKLINVTDCQIDTNLDFVFIRLFGIIIQYNSEPWGLQGPVWAGRARGVSTRALCGSAPSKILSNELTPVFHGTNEERRAGGASPLWQAGVAA